MRSLLALTVSVITLSGCVTENSYEGNDKPVVENKINNTGAARTRIALALEYLNTGNSSQAKYNLERAASFAPDLPEVHYSFAYYYQQVGENTLADNSYQKAIKIDPNDPNTRNNYGVFLCGINEYDRATEQLLKAIAIPSYIRVAESYENLALCAIEFNDFDNAESYFRSAINHSSMRASSLIGLSALYYAKSDLHRAQEVLKRFEKSGQVSSRSLFLSYLIEQRMGHIEKAETTAATILQTYPTSNEAVLIREQQFKQSEFELLRMQYRQAQLDELKADSSPGVVSSEPKIRIVKKKKAPVESKAQTTNNKTTQVATTPTAINEQSATITASVLLATEQTATQPEVVDDPAFVQQQSTVTETPANIPAAIDIATPSVDTSAVLAALAVASPAKQSIPEQDTLTNEVNDTKAVMSALAIPSVQKPNTRSEENTTSGFYTSEVKTLGVTSSPVPTVHLANSKQTEQNNTASIAKQQAKDGVKIVSFGPPTTDPKPVTDNPSASTFSANAAPLSDDEKVVFYQPTKDAAVFAGQNNRYATDPDVRFSDNDPINQAPMLNSQIPQLSTPYHVLQDGENLFSISVRYNVKLQKLLQWNGLKESDRVVNGTKIYLNDPNIYYKINAGDTLYSIATERRLLIDQLMRWNKLSPDVTLKPGHRLLLVDPESYAL
ncbi:type IV pilus biogenesis/stability protein PilW [Pseudoalteromonas shioyasakiensis]|uniref:type IV pilus biogenesis/stability protein PilW n=1 Tax=Pseudoalteromonas shioyasakiensis TaxID=1190813 RepID=UPI00211997CE|nr:type IV pilus biogenesis/stability protein PilW [Pseudoalteromonas shioyasakiensis]MCQ8878758.1 type IV pilus biogenesis/stability protein PilW [Pseudoalteromonas shioyasakiensis]